jgi:hypothetical protein
MIFAISEALRRRFPRWEASMIAVAQRICTRQCERSGHRCSGEWGQCAVRELADHAPAA